jgi:integrase
MNNLNNTTIKNAKARDKNYKLSDGKGLYLLITKSGGKWWRFKYRFDDKEKLISLGTYPEVSLKEARESRDLKRKQVSQGLDPSAERKNQKALKKDAHANSFERVAREWHAKQEKIWTKRYSSLVLKRLENYIFPFIAEIPIDQLKAADLLEALKVLENKGTIETARRQLQICGQICRYAVARTKASRDITQDLKGALAPVRKKHLASITEPEEVAKLLRAIDDYEGYKVTQLAMQLAPLLFVRPGELRHAEWKEINLAKAEWNIPKEKMKMRQAHLVPLSKQALGILEEVRKITGSSPYVFPGARGHKRPMSNNTLLAALRRMGYTKDEMTPHGFRAMARTILDEVLNIRPDFIEHQLAHAVKDPNGRAYNRTKFLPQRREMMQKWADYLDKIKKK